MATTEKKKKEKPYEVSVKWRRRKSDEKDI